MATVRHQEGAVLGRVHDEHTPQHPSRSSTFHNNFHRSYFQLQAFQLFFTLSFYWQGCTFPTRVINRSHPLTPICQQPEFAHNSAVLARYLFPTLSLTGSRRVFHGPAAIHSQWSQEHRQQPNARWRRCSAHHCRQLAVERGRPFKQQRAEPARRRRRSREEQVDFSVVPKKRHWPREAQHVA